MMEGMSRVRVLGALGLGVALVAAVAAGRQWLSPAPPPADTTASEPAPPSAPADPADSRVHEWLQKVELKRGDTLVSALKRAGVSLRTASEIAAALQTAEADLKRLRPGDMVEITWTAAGQPTAVTWQAGPWLGFAAMADEDVWKATRFETTPDVRVEAVQGMVTRSLWEAVDDVGEAPPLVLALVAIFESEFDFTADTRQGDRFRLVVEKRYANDTFVNYGRVLAAQYASGKRLLTGIGFAAGPRDRFAYYDLAGRSLKKSFLKSPLEFSRITSRFTYARPHPILGGKRPHLAVDYGAPPGTPVRAVADGTVVSAGWDGGNGISIRLRHRSGYETMYNHLSRVAAAVRRGARVEQRQVIGYVGATGLATGPHLDYRVAKDGVFVNPLSEKFIPGDPISTADRPRFQREAHELVEQLEQETPFAPAS
jgi:murein DD-endopeptidase MepM/ murein hydrolase activator NlpD